MKKDEEFNKLIPSQLKDQPKAYNRRRQRRNTLKKEEFLQQGENYNIYDDAHSRSQSKVNSDSSFELDTDSQKGDVVEQKDTIEKVLLRLGLTTKERKHQNQELQIVVNNIIENCIGTVDDQENLATYEAIYGAEYDQLVKNRSFQGSIIISELSDLQKINKISNRGIYGVYKQLRLFAKKISMACQSIVEHTLFESFILLIIILNSIKMATDDPLKTQTGSTTIQTIFTVLYTMQMIVKILAFGFIFANKAYLRDPWNMLDFVIVATSLLPLVISINFSVSSLRAIRVLRPLKTITKVKALKMIVRTLFFSFSLVMDSLYILIFVMVVFSIAGTQLFSGLLKNRCMQLVTGTLTETLCTTGSTTCGAGFECVKGIESPNFSITNFDTFFWSMLSVFRSLTMQGWSDIMISLQRAYSQFSVIYSLMIVFFCEYVLLNMTLAILKYKYSQVKGDTIQQQEQQVSQYEPQFLKKIGVYNQISNLVQEAPLARYRTDSNKIFVGCSNSGVDFNVNGYKADDENQHEQLLLEGNFDLTMQRFQNTKMENRKSGILSKQNPLKIDIEELKNLGKVQEMKWDAKALDFETIEFDENLAHIHNSQINSVSNTQQQLNGGRAGRKRGTKIKPRDSVSKSSDSQQSIADSFSSYDSDSDSSNSGSDSDFSQNELKDQFNQMGNNINIKINNRSRKIINHRLNEVHKKLSCGRKNSLFGASISNNNQVNQGTNNMIRSGKMLPSLKNIQNNAAIRSRQSKELSQLDNMLRLISESQPQPLTSGSAPGSSKFLIHLPEINLNDIQPEKLFQRFDDLGDYQIKRVDKSNELGYFQVRHNKKRNLPGQGKQEKEHHGNVVKEMMDENQLDLKELQLVNELSKKELKCRIKAKSVLNQYKLLCSYDFTRVIVSQKVKEVERKKEELLENMNNLNFNVRYRANNERKRLSQVTNFSKGSFLGMKGESTYLRSLNSKLKGIKLPEMVKQQGSKLHSQRGVSQMSIRNTEHSNNYLKLLKSHQMQEKIQMEYDRVMQVFFKKDYHTNHHNASANGNTNGGGSNDKQPGSNLKLNLLNIKQSSQQDNPNNGQSAADATTLIDQYSKVKQDDIFQRHGNILLDPPNQTCLYDNQEDLFEKINMRPEEYEIYVKGLFGMLKVARNKTLLFITRPLYDNFMLMLVIFNTIMLSLNGLVDTKQRIFIDISLMFTVAFTVDLALKIFAFGSEFFGDIMNLFDAFVVSISLVDLSLGGGSGSNLSALRAVRILRAFRVLRITRLIRTLNYMKIVMSVVSSVITQFVYIFMLLALFIFIYTLLGMQIFGGQLLPQSVTGIRQSFDTFFDSFFSVFQVLTVENWNDIETLILTSKTGVFSVFYLISWIFIGNWILLNLLQAILLDGFDKDSTIFNTVQEKQDEVQLQKISQQDSQSEEQFSNEDCSIEQKNIQTRYSLSDASLFIFLPDSPIRLLSMKISSSKIFQNFIVLMIGLSSIKLVMDTYIKQKDVQLHEIAIKLDLIFNCVFIFQCLVKIISQGFLVGQNAYLKSGWSKLDFFIVFTAVIDMNLDIDLSILKLFRTLRPLRIISRNPDMKIIISSLGESMLGIFNVLIIILCVFLMIGILGINLLQNKLNFCNKSAQLDHNFYGPYGVSQEDCLAAGGTWTTQFINFDNIGNALLSLYVFSTRENWPYYAYTFMDASETAPQKNSSQLIFMIFTVLIIFVCSYFFMDLLVGVLFMNFHEAEQKIRPKKLTDRQINWKNLQKIIIQQDPCFKLYLKPSNKFNQFFYNIVNFKYFDIFITMCILGNILVMMISTDDQTDTTKNTLSMINFVFSLIFIIEFVLKFCAYARSYFLSGWNIFDFFVVMASILDIILEYSGSKTENSSAVSILPQIARIFRVLRVTKLLRMFKRFKGLQKLIETFLFSLPALAKGLSIVCLFLFISSVLASYLFKDIAGDYSGNFDQIKNFSNFNTSFQLLFIITTGQNWYFYMYESMLSGYVRCQHGDNCTNWYYLLFWLIYVFFSQKVFMELFVLIVLDQFEANYINENNPLGIFSLFEDDFRTKWIQMTGKYHSQKIQAKRLIQLILVLKQPLGLGKNELMAKYQDQLRENQKITEEEIQENLTELDMKLKKNAAKLLNKMTVMKNRMYLGYHETFYNFAKLSLVSDLLDDINEQQKVALQQMHKQSQQALQSLKPEGNLFYYVEQANQSTNNQTLNPIELILFSQMIIKSWHNYSMKSIWNKKQGKINNKVEQNQAYRSLNNSCASDIEEAQIQKLENPRKFRQRKGLLQRRVIDDPRNNVRIMPNIEQHYSNDRKKNVNKKINSLNPNRKREHSLQYYMQTRGIEPKLAGQLKIRKSSQDSED